MTQPLALLLTLLVEVLVVLAVVRLARGSGPGVGRWLLVALCASLITHPLAWWAHAVLPMPLWPRALTIEAAVVLVEAGLYRGLVPASVRKAFAVALLANGASFGLGVWLTL